MTNICTLTSNRRSCSMINGIQETLCLLFRDVPDRRKRGRVIQAKRDLMIEGEEVTVLFRATGAGRQPLDGQIWLCSSEEVVFTSKDGFLMIVLVRPCELIEERGNSVARKYMLGSGPKGAQWQSLDDSPDHFSRVYIPDRQGINPTNNNTTWEGKVTNLVHWNGRDAIAKIAVKITRQSGNKNAKPQRQRKASKAA